MKTLLLSILTITLSTFSISQDCSGLIISEYIEGWSNNKAIELYNASPNPIDMGPYNLVRFQNQNQTPGNGADIEGILMPYDTYVVVLDKRDSTGTGLEAPVWDELQMLTDTFVNPNYNGGVECMYFNGNDAVMLLNEDQSGGLIVYDLFGKVGDSDFQDGWGPYVATSGMTEYISENHTLIRKPDVLKGVTLNPTTFDPTVEWDSLPANTFDNLGWHTCNCAPTGINEIKDNGSIEIFPNPSEDGWFEINSMEKIDDVVIYSITGELIYKRKMDQSDLSTRVETNGWIKGVYLVNIRTVGNTVSTKRIVVN